MPLKMMREQRVTFEHTNFRMGVVGNVASDIRSDRPGNHRFLRLADNMRPFPYGSWRVRGGSRRLSSATLPVEPHSLGKWKVEGTAGRLFVVGTFHGSIGALFEAKSNAYTVQVTPFTPTQQPCFFQQLNEALFMAQIDGSDPPMFYEANNPADTWHSAKLPKPIAAPTFAADSGGGSLTSGVTYFYRVRHRFRNGSGLAGPVSAGRTPVGPNLTVNINANLVSALPRSDYVGWTLERTKQGGASAGPFYWVADGTATTYADGTADAGLGYRSDDDLHGEPPSLDGLIAYKERLVGWRGSSIFFSQAIIDEQGTGICNWDAELEYRVTPDDGDAIQLCVVASDHVLIFKRYSIHVLDGDDPDSFRLYQIGSGVGAAGPRCARHLNGVTYALGERGFLRIVGRRIQLIGRREVGHYVEPITTAVLGNAIVGHELGDALIVAIPTDGARNNEAVCLELETETWWHITNWRFADILSQLDREFAGARFIFADYRNHSAGFPQAVAVGQLVTGNGVPPGTTVAAVLSKDTIRLSATASGSEDNTTLTFWGGGGVAAGCQLRFGSDIARRSAHHVWIGFDGTLDERDYLGAGGSAIPMLIETHPLDEGMPTTLKEAERLVSYASSSGHSLVATLLAKPSSRSATLPMELASVGSKWGTFVWATVKWGGAASSEDSRGVPIGLVGTAFVYRVSGDLQKDYIWEGYALDALLLPDRRLSDA